MSEYGPSFALMEKSLQGKKGLGVYQGSYSIFEWVTRK